MPTAFNGMFPGIMGDMFEDDDIKIPDFLFPQGQDDICVIKGCSVESLHGAKKCMDHQVEEDFAWVLNEVEDILEKGQ